MLRCIWPLILQCIIYGPGTCIADSRDSWRHVQMYIENLHRDPAMLQHILDHMCDALNDRCIIKFLRAVTAVELRNKQEHYSMFIPGIDAYQ